MPLPVEWKCLGTHSTSFSSGGIPSFIQTIVCVTEPFWTLWRRVESSWNVMAHGDARVRKWRGNWRMEWVASTLHTTSEHGVSSITIADAHTSAASSRLNCSLCRFKWTRPFRRKTKSGFCACAITFQTQSTKLGCVRSNVVCILCLSFRAS